MFHSEMHLMLLEITCKTIAKIISNYLSKPMIPFWNVETPLLRRARRIQMWSRGVVPTALVSMLIGLNNSYDLVTIHMLFWKFLEVQRLLMYWQFWYFIRFQCRACGLVLREVCSPLVSRSNWYQESCKQTTWNVAVFPLPEEKLYLYLSVSPLHGQRLYRYWWMFPHMRWDFDTFISVTDSWRERLC